MLAIIDIIWIGLMVGFVTAILRGLYVSIIYQISGETDKVMENNLCIVTLGMIGSAFNIAIAAILVLIKIL